MNPIEKTVRRVDDLQQRRRTLAFAFAVIKKFGDDRAGNLAALIAYYGFLSLFPLMLVMVAVLGIVLRNNVDLRDAIVGSALGQFPVIGDQLRTNIKALTGGGTGVVLGVGTVGALWAGMGVTQAVQNAFNDIWDVPLKDRPNFLMSRLRGLLMLVTLGAMTLASTFLSGLGTGTGARFFWLGALGLLGTLALNLAVFMTAFRVLTARNVSWGDVFPGAAFGAVMWTALQSLGSYLILHQVKHASALYGVFGFVLALLGWIYLGAQITLYAAEVNVVRKNRLYPRSLMPPPLSEADKQTLVRAAKVEERRPEERVEVTFHEPREARADGPDGSRAEGPLEASHAAPKDRRPGRPRTLARWSLVGAMSVAGAALARRIRAKRTS